jgi:hypothetical protein
LEQLTLHIGGEELALAFHDRMTVVSGIGLSERRELVEMLVGALAGGLGQPAELRYVDATGLCMRAVSSGDGTVRHLNDDGTPAPNLLAVLGLDRDGLERLGHVSAADLGLLATEIGAPEPAELIEARATLTQLTEELERATLARDASEALRLDLDELEERLRQVREGEAKRRYARILVQLEQVRAEAAALRGGAEAVDSHRRLVAAAGDIRKLAQRWRRAAAKAEQESARFADRDRLDPRALKDALTFPAEVPEQLERLAAEYERAEAARADLEAKLQNWTISHLPEPSHPDVVRLGRHDQASVWEAAHIAVEASRTLGEASLALGGLDAEGAEPTMAIDIERAQDRVQEAEGLADKRRTPALVGGTAAAVLAIGLLALFPLASPLALALAGAIAFWARVLPQRAVEVAEKAEEQVLARAGIPSYLAFHMRRIQATLEPVTRESLEMAAHEHRRAMSRWTELGGVLSPKEALPLEAEVRAYAEALTRLEGSGAAVEETHRRLVEEAEPAADRARRKLVDACRPFGVDDLAVAVPMVRREATAAATARLQHTLEQAERDEEVARQKIDARLAELGFDEGDLDARIGGYEWALSTAEERLNTRKSARPLDEVETELAALEDRARRESRPEWGAGLTPADAEEPDPAELERRRDEALASWNAAQRLVPDLQRINDRRNAVERRVAVLDAGVDGADISARVTAREVEPQLQARLAAARRAGGTTHDETVPLFVNDALLRLGSEAKWGVLDMLERCSSQVQLIYLTDDPEVVTWARRRVGADALSLLEPVGESV